MFRTRHRKKVKIMNRLFIIGNGFDIHHSLPTRYANFRDYVKNVDFLVFSTIEEILNCYYYGEDISDWNEIEDKLRLFQDMDYYEILDNEVISSVETDDDKAWYWDSAKLIADEYVKRISKLETYFNEWINSINIDSENSDSNIHFTSNDKFITFNYTDTLQKKYDVLDKQIVYLHGRREGERIFGYNHPITEPIPLPEDNSEEPDIRIEEAKKSLNEIPTLFNKECKDIINQHNTVFEDVKNYDQIIFMGWALGKQDECYMDTILSKIQDKNVSISVVYFSADDLDRYHDYFKRIEYDDRDILYCTWKNVGLVFE